MSHLRFVTVSAACTLAGIMACSSGEKPGTTDTTSACESALAVQRFRSLAIVEDEVVLDARARNDVDGPWSFRRRMEELALPGEDPTALTLAWLATWRASAKVNLFDVAARPMVEHKAFCNWLRSTPSNGCDDSCTTCTERKFDLARAPFRLLAITNRADQQLSIPDATTAGEVRYTYGLTQGAGDDAASTPMFMSIIFEYHQPLKGRTRKDLAEKWYALGQHAALDEAYKTELDALLRDLTGPGAQPERARGSSISQVRTNEREFDWQWDMREYLVTDKGFTLSGTQNTPDEKVNGSAAFARFLKDNRAAVLAGEHVLPQDLAGGGVGIITKWSAPEAETGVLEAFSLQTCNGCHQNKMHDFNLHITPFKSGIAKLSTFMNDPADPTKDDLGAREAFMRGQLCVATP